MEFKVGDKVRPRKGFELLAPKGIGRHYNDNDIFVVIDNKNYLDQEGITVQDERGYLKNYPTRHFEPVEDEPKEEKNLADRISDLEEENRAIRYSEEKWKESALVAIEQARRRDLEVKKRGVPPVLVEDSNSIIDHFNRLCEEPIYIWKLKDLRRKENTDAILKELPEAFGDDFKCQVCDEKIDKHAQLKKVKFKRKSVEVIYDLFCHTPEGQTEEIIFTKKKGVWSVEQKCLPQFELRKKSHKVKRFDRKTIQKQRFEDLKRFYGDDLVCPCCKTKLQRETQWYTRENHIAKFGRLKTWFRRRVTLKFNLCCHGDGNGFIKNHYIRFEKLKDDTWRIHKLKV